MSNSRKKLHFILPFILQISLQLSNHVLIDIRHQIVEIVAQNPSHVNSTLNHRLLRNKLLLVRNGCFSLLIPKAARCNDGLYNKAAKLDMHNFYGTLKLEVNHFRVFTASLFDDYGNVFTCDQNAEEKTKGLLEDLINDEESKFHSLLVKWNFDIARTDFHFANSTHAEISFVCLPGYHLKVWNDLHLRTHVDVRSDGIIAFHEKMRSCICTPESCEESVTNYIHSIKAEIVNPDISQNMKTKICAGTGGEITIDDVKCSGNGMELEDDITVRGCVVTNHPLCVSFDEGKKRTNRKFHLVTGGMLASILFVLVVF